MKKEISTKTLASASLVFVAFGYTLLSIAARLLNEGFTPLVQVYVRIGIGFLFALFIFRNHIRWNRFLYPPKKDFVGLLLMGVIGYSVTVYFLTVAALTTKLINVSIIFATIPLFVYVYSFLFLKKTIIPKLLFTVLVSIIGVWIVASKSFNPSLTTFGTGELFALLSAICGAWYAIGRKTLTNYLNNHEITIWVMGIAFVSTFILATFNKETLTFQSFFNNTVLLGLIIGASFNIIASFLENYAFGHLDAVIGSQLLLTENVFALLLGFLFYQEYISLPEVVGAIIILISVYIANKHTS